MTHVLLAVDPGKVQAGVALYIDLRLEACALLRPKPGNPYTVALMAAAWLRKFHAGAVNVVVCEGQQIYPGPNRADPNDLLPLANVVGGVFARVPANTHMMPLPREWKGSLPKEIHQRRLLQRLDDRERGLIVGCGCPASLLHNVIDAVGLGKWALGEIRPEPEGLKQ